MGFEKPMTGAQRVARRREALRAQGLRPRTVWVPDTNSAAFKAQARRDCERLWDMRPDDEQAMAWVQAMNEELFASLPPYYDDDVEAR